MPLNAPAPHMDPTGELCRLIFPPESGTDAATARETCIPSVTPSAAPCWAELIEWETRPNTVGEIHVPDAATGQYTYTLGATTSIEVKMKASGSNWESTGAVKTTKDSSTDSGWNVGAAFANQLQSYWRFDKYRLRGYCPPQETIKVSSWMSGAVVGVGVGQWDGKCITDYALWAVPFSPGTWLSKTTGRAFHYVVGAVAFGVGLYSESEWTSQNAFRIDFGQSSVMCGNDNPIPSACLVYKQ